MKLSDYVSLLPDLENRRVCTGSLLARASLVCLVFGLWSVFIATDVKEKLPRWPGVNAAANTPSTTCKNQFKPNGTDTLPEGIISKSSNFEMRPLWGSPKKKENATSMNLLAIPVGIKQKENVNQMVKKFPSSNFVLMLFHYDGVTDKWSDLEWNRRAIHVSAINQTKWWFAKRFLHPDIVDEYSYIFLWDEDLGLENFDPIRFLSIVKDEGLEISQPALDAAKSEVHSPITARASRSKVHRRIYRSVGKDKCDGSSKDPPCTGWVEIMAPVFSRAAWRCTWHMIQNDLIHGWGLDGKLGYCAQGDRTKNVGVVDSEYIVHKGFPTLGNNESNTESSNAKASSRPRFANDRFWVRWQSFREYKIFQERWEKAKRGDNCWVDLYPEINGTT